jgi:hypothetical protein
MFMSVESYKAAGASVAFSERESSSPFPATGETLSLCAQMIPALKKQASKNRTTRLCNFPGKIFTGFD